MSQPVNQNIFIADCHRRRPNALAPVNASDPHMGASRLPVGYFQ